MQPCWAWSYVNESNTRMNQVIWFKNNVLTVVGIVSDDVVSSAPVPQQKGCISWARDNVAITSNVGLGSRKTGHHIPVTKHDLSEFPWMKSEQMSMCAHRHFICSKDEKVFYMYKLAYKWHKITKDTSTCLRGVNTETLIPETTCQDVAVVGCHHKAVRVDLNALINQICDLPFTNARVIGWERKHRPGVNIGKISSLSLKIQPSFIRLLKGQSTQKWIFSYNLLTLMSF